MPKNEAREHNLRLYNESIRKDLDIILTSKIPNQVNLIKTIIWVNLPIIGFVIKLYSENKDIGLMFFPFLLSFMAIFYLLFLFLLKKFKYTKNIDGLAISKIKYIENIDGLPTPKLKDIISINRNDKEKINGLNKMNEAYINAFNYNMEFVKKIDNYIFHFIILTLASILISFLFVVYLSSNKRAEAKIQNTESQKVLLKNELINDIKKLSIKKQEYYFHRVRADLIEEELKQKD